MELLFEMSNFFEARTPPAYLLKRDIAGKTPREEKGPGIFLFCYAVYGLPYR